MITFKQFLEADDLDDMMSNHETVEPINMHEVWTYMKQFDKEDRLHHVVIGKASLHFTYGESHLYVDIKHDEGEIHFTFYSHRKNHTLNLSLEKYIGREKALAAKIFSNADHYIADGDLTYSYEPHEFDDLIGDGQ